MKKNIIASLAIFSTLALGGAGIAEAKGGKNCGGKGGRGGKRVMKQLIKSGAVTKEQLAALKPAWKEVRACFKAVKAGAQAKGSCKEKFAAVRSQKLQLLEGALPKITDAKLKERVERHIAKIKARAAKKGA